MLANAVPPWIAAQTQQLLAQQGHAWLLQGASGLGQYELALSLARAWLCEQPSAHGACGQCVSCHAMDVRTHADVCVLMPEVQMQALQWPLTEKALREIDEKKRKPSKEIRIDSMRNAVDFSQHTSARGRGKVMLVFPAEQMNAITANALLKTLEEPPGDMKFVLATESAHQLLPTIRSRCMVHTMAWPDAATAVAWLQTHGMSAHEAESYLRAAGGRPDDALLLRDWGRDPGMWAAFPRAMAHGNVSFVKDWTPVQLLDALQKLCHDVWVLGYGASPRFFEPDHLPKMSSVAALSQWSKALMQTARSVEHPFSSGLMLEAMVVQAQSALNAHPLHPVEALT
jgi:DNA polymerase III subunit delta'